MAQTYQSINQTTLGSNTASVTFSSIPNTYTHLELLIQARSGHGSMGDFVLVRYNGDSTSGNYAYQMMIINGTTVVCDGNPSSSFTGFPAISGNGNTSNIFGICRLIIPEYKNTSVTKTGFAQGNSASGSISYTGSTTNGMYWNSTAAISSITLSLNSGNSFLTGSTFSLYGFTKA
jgi:hypothetical protein